MANSIKVDVVSDFACPWCYMGKKRLIKALEMRPDLDVDINWLPYQLNPDIPSGKVNREKYYIEKFGEERYKELLKNIKQVGLGDGINFCDGIDTVAPNTLAAHRLMYWASQDPAIDSALLQEKIFKAHHEDCEDIGSFEVLVRIASELGMNGEEIKEKLQNGTDEELVSDLVKRSYSMGVSGVPFFIINDKYTISGAQEADYLLSAFDQISKLDDN